MDAIRFDNVYFSYDDGEMENGGDVFSPAADFALRGVDLSVQEGEFVAVLGHNGSETSSSLEFLQYLQIKEAVVSCGKNNPYNHPRDKVLENVAAAGADLYRTDENGTVVVSVKDVGCYSVKTAK